MQLRDRDLEGGALLAWCQALAAAARRGARTRDGSVRVVVNRRVDVAIALGADGVHLGFDAVAPATARRLLADAGLKGALVGVSAHTPGEVREAASAGATYAHLAPIWSPLSKPAERPALGLEALASAAGHGLPVLAQGGVTPEHARAAVAAGAAGVAVTGDVLMSDEPEARAMALRDALS